MSKAKSYLGIEPMNEIFNMVVLVMIMEEMTGRTFKLCNYKIKDLEHVVNWLAQRGLIASINKQKFTVEIDGLVNGNGKKI